MVSTLITPYTVSSLDHIFFFSSPVLTFLLLKAGNYHHGYASEDGHGHGWHGAKERRTIDLEAVIQLQKIHDKRGLLGLNLGGNSNTNARANSNTGLGGLLGGGGNGKNGGALIGGSNGIGLNLKKRGKNVHVHSHGLSDKELRRIVDDADDNAHIHIHAHKRVSSVNSISLFSLSGVDVLPPSSQSLADDEDEDYDEESELEKRDPRVSSYKLSLVKTIPHALSFFLSFSCSLLLVTVTVTTVTVTITIMSTSTPTRGMKSR